MNRKQRRAATKLGPPASANSSDSGERIRQLFVQAVSHERARKFDDAVRAYRQVLAIDADHAEACNNLGRVLQAQGKTKDASVYYARSLGSCRNFWEQYAGICARFFRCSPSWRKRSAARPPHGRSACLRTICLGNNFEAVAADPLFLHLLQSTTVRDVGFERLLTAMRHSLLKAAAAGLPAANRLVSFTCALAKQCHQRVRFCSHTARKQPVSLLGDADRQCACVARRNRTDAAAAVAIICRCMPSIRHGAARTRWAPAMTTC